jgi:hypothetical protein
MYAAIFSELHKLYNCLSVLDIYWSKFINTCSVRRDKWALLSSRILSVATFVKGTTIKDNVTTSVKEKNIVSLVLNGKRDNNFIRFPSLKKYTNGLKRHAYC